MHSIHIALLWTILDRFCAVGIHQSLWPLVFFWTKTSVTGHPCWHAYIFCKVPGVVIIGRRPEHRFEMRSFNMQTHHSRDIWLAFNPLKPVGKDGIRSRLPEVFYQWLQLSYSSCTKDVFIRLQEAPRTIETWPQVRYIAIWTQHERTQYLFQQWLLSYRRVRWPVWSWHHIRTTRFANLRPALDSLQHHIESGAGIGQNRSIFQTFITKMN